MGEVHTMDLSFLDKQDTYSVLLSAIYAAEANPEYRLLSDLMYLLDSESFKNFLTLYEGQTLKIPTLDQLAKMLQAMYILAYHDIDKMPLDQVKAKLGIPQESYLPYYKKLKQALNREQIQVGGILDGYVTAELQNKRENS